MRRDCVWIVLLWSLPIFFLRPFQNAPFVDDWAYAWSVENFLKTGTLKILDWSTSINPAQTLWGALFCLPAGFSFAALRISTWVLSAAALTGLYLLLRESGVERRSALIGTATLAVYPVYLQLSYTFMTDVPFVCWSVWFFYAVVRMGKELKPKWLFAAVIFACLATAVRLTGSALGAALPLIVLLRWGKVQLPKKLALSMVPLLFLAGLLWWYPHHIEVRADLTWIDNSPVWRTNQLKNGFVYIHQSLVSNWLFWVGALGIPLLPIAAGRLRWGIWRRVSVVVALCALMLIIRPLVKGGLWVPLNSGFWTANGVSEWESDVPARQIPAPPFPWYRESAVGVATILFAIAVGGTSKYSSGFAGLALLSVLAIHYLQMSVLWLWADRYILAVLPGVVTFLLLGSPISRPAFSALCLGLLALVGFVGLQDQLAYNRAVWNGVDDVLARGIHPIDLQGGYTINGWFQYAHPENAMRDGKGDVVVNWVNEDRLPARFQISNSTQPGWSVLESIPYQRRLAKSGIIYVLEKGTK